MRRTCCAGSSAEYNSRICGFGVMTRIPVNKRADPRLRVGLHRPGTLVLGSVTTRETIR